MRYILFVPALLFLSCSDGTYIPPKASLNFHTQNYISQTDSNTHITIKDIRQNLLHINSKIGCEAIHVKPENALAFVENFCQNLQFYGFDDWRVPTLKETENFSKGMDADGLVPYFTFPECKRIVGTKDDGTLGSITTHNVSPKFEEVQLKMPSGIRCVREDVTQP